MIVKSKAILVTSSTDGVWRYLGASSPGREVNADGFELRFAATPVGRRAAKSIRRLRDKAHISVSGANAAPALFYALTTNVAVL